MTWLHIRTAIRQVFHRNTAVSLTYSVMAAGNFIRDQDGDVYKTSKPSETQIKQVQQVLQDVAGLFHAHFDQTFSPFSFKLILKFLGHEKPTDHPSDFYSVPYDPIASGLGQLRIGWVENYTQPCQAYPPGPTGGDVGGDIRLMIGARVRDISRDILRAFGLHSPKQFLKEYLGNPLPVVLNRQGHIWRIETDARFRWKGDLVSVAVGASGRLLGANKKHAVYTRKGVDAHHPFGLGFERVGFKLKIKRVFPGALWLGLDVKNEPFVRVGDGPLGDRWRNLGTQTFDRLACAPRAIDQQIRVLGLRHGKIFELKEVSFSNPNGTGTWEEIPSNMLYREICLGPDGSIWGLSAKTGGLVHKEKTIIRDTMVSLSVSPAGDVFGIRSWDRRLCLLDQRRNHWKTTEIDNVEQVSVGIEF